VTRSLFNLLLCFYFLPAFHRLSLFLWCKVSLRGYFKSTIFFLLLLLVPPSILFWSWVSPLTTKLRLFSFLKLKTEDSKLDILIHDVFLTKLKFQYFSIGIGIGDRNLKFPIPEYLSSFIESFIENSGRFVYMIKIAKQNLLSSNLRMNL
jgi:hypothetical protein